MNELIKGYHGTNKDKAPLILKENYRINKDEQNKLYLGAGVYFFYKFDDAVDWNIKLFKKDFSCMPNFKELKEKYTIIESKIQVDKNDILDLDEKESLYKLERLVEKINKKLESRQDYWTASNRTTAIINFLYDMNLLKKKVIIKTFFERIGTEKFNELRFYPRKMFCVKDVGIILNNIEKIDIEESLFESIMYFYS